jgi:hypothetical protein
MLWRAGGALWRERGREKFWGKMKKNEFETGIYFFLLLLGKSTDHPLKFRAIFNSVTDVSIFTMYPPKF